MLILQMVGNLSIEYTGGFACLCFWNVYPRPLHPHGYVYTYVYTLCMEKIMTEVELDVKQWGNNLGVRLPGAIARESKLKVHQRVRISVLNGEIIIKPVVETALTLEQRLALFIPAVHGGEVMVASQTLGAENW